MWEEEANRTQGWHKPCSYSLTPLQVLPGCSDPAQSTHGYSEIQNFMFFWVLLKTDIDKKKPLPVFLLELNQ